MTVWTSGLERGRASPYWIHCATHTICRVRIAGTWRYELWTKGDRALNRPAQFVSSHANADEAKAAHARLTQAVPEEVES